MLPMSPVAPAAAAAATGAAAAGAGKSRAVVAAAGEAPSLRASAVPFMPGGSTAAPKPAAAAPAAAGAGAPVSSKPVPGFSSTGQPAATAPSAGASSSSAVPRKPPAVDRRAFLPPWLLIGAQSLGVQQQQPAAVGPAAHALPASSSVQLPRVSSVSSSTSSSVEVAGDAAAASLAAAAAAALKRPCHMCKAAESAVLLMPCKHMVLCKACAEVCQANAGQLPAWNKPKCPRADCQAITTQYVIVHHS
jgi:hypothetical protein